MMDTTSWYARNKEHKKAYQREWYQQNKERLKQTNKNSVYLRKYNLSVEDVKALVEKQDHKCAICSGRFKTPKQTHVDHCHTTGQVRKILCGDCNRGLGGFRDSTLFLENAIEYLKQYENDK